MERSATATGPVQCRSGRASLGQTRQIGDFSGGNEATRLLRHFQVRRTRDTRGGRSGGRVRRRRQGVGTAACVGASGLCPDLEGEGNVEERKMT